MRLLLVNPNMTEAMTDSMATIARRVAGGRAEILPLTALRGFPYIASRAEAQIAGGIALEMIADNIEGIDAVIIAAFGDPGLVGAREIFDVPVVGMAEASVLSAAMLGERFSIVTFSPVMTRWYSDCVAATGLAGRFTGVRTPRRHVPELLNNRAAQHEALVALAREAALEDGADVVILGGAPLAGLAPEIAGEVPAVVLDPISAATAQAQTLASLRTAGLARASRPIGKASVGLSPALSRIIAMEAP
ncbi:aspartate/glutamate racemase family protein (plasmid) [Salipiger sp. H15]|uniref:Aspartate/glutamate racemase family protein n=1 Tax=Alloyangia sp. H15 TaxID=3029062 RepID=A0AAU8AT37_9RHOB